ncbi:ead/Ea22-like family protein [Escherichia coli]|nr:ead/Ea22-like family protein [Escherichia coli]
MESNIKGLVAAGHEMASELKAECGAVDMRSVAKLISDLATQLEVQLVRANALAEDHQRATESIKQADSAVKLAHEKFSVLAAENELARKAVQAFCDVVGDNTEVIAEVVGRDGVLVILEAMKATGNMPATDAFLAEVRAQAFNDLCSVFVKDATVVGLDDGDIVTVKEATDALLHCAEQLRKGGNQ